LTSKVYKTANGKNLDVGALILKNEKVRAVGNMDINARGDKIDSSGKTTVSRARQIARNLRKQTVNTTDSPVLSSQKQLKNQEAVSGIHAALDRAQKK
jgi:deoxycytidylate deaminase